MDSLARPGRNLTGLTHFEPAMGGKWLELLKEMAPGTTQVAFLYNPDTARRGAGSAVYVQSFENIAATLGLRPVMMLVRDAAELGQALDAFGGAPTRSRTLSSSHGNRPFWSPPTLLTRAEKRSRRATCCRAGGLVLAR